MNPNGRNGRVGVPRKRKKTGLGYATFACCVSTLTEALRPTTAHLNTNNKIGRPFWGDTSMMPTPIRRGMINLFLTAKFGPHLQREGVVHEVVLVGNEREGQVAVGDAGEQVVSGRTAQKHCKAYSKRENPKLSSR